MRHRLLAQLRSASSALLPTHVCLDLRGLGIYKKPMGSSYRSSRFLGYETIYGYKL